MLVSIIIPCYNQGVFLTECLESVYKQIYPIWECIIIDDGSPDETQLIAEEWVNRDERFQVYQTSNRGVSAARNLGLSKAKGDWVQFLDADDYLAPEKLSASLEVYYKDKKINFIATNFKHFKSDLLSTFPPFCKLKGSCLDLNKMMYEWNGTFSLPIHTVLLKKDLIGDLLFPVGLTAQEDWYFWVSIFKKKCHSYFINKPFALYRFHGESRIMSKSIFQDQLKVYNLFSHLLTKEEHKHLSKVLIERYLDKNHKLNHRIQNLKKSDTYQVGMMMKKIFRILGLIKFGKKTFQYLRTFKKTDY